MARALASVLFSAPAGTGSEPASDALEARFRASVPPVALAVGGFYVVFSGSIFVNTRDAWATPYWGATVVFGLLCVSFGLWAGRHPGHKAHPVLATALAVAAFLLVATVVVLAQEPELALYLALLMGASGAFLLPWRLLAVAQVGAAAALVLAAVRLDPSVDAGLVVLLALAFPAAWLLRLLRVRSIRRHALAAERAAGSLERSEARFRSLAETAKDTILLLDDKGRLTYLNPAGLESFGLRAEDVPGRFLAQHLGPSATDPEGLLGTHEVKVQRRDGTTFAAEVSLARTQLAGDVAYTGVLRDVSERNKAIAASRRAASHDAEVEQLRRMNEFKTQFLNMAAHELNTPLTPLRLQLHLLKGGQMGPLNDKQAKSVALLDRNVARLSGLVAELLDVARLQGGRLRLQAEPLTLDALVDEVMDSFTEAARRVGVQLSFAGEQGQSVVADRNRVTQVLYNLISNAIKFTPEGGRVTVAVRDQGRDVAVTVQDTGLGLTPEQMDRLFQPFTQVHDPMAITAAGTGLGLYISRGLVEAHGGRLSVASPGPGKGSTFTFTLPAASAQPMAAPVQGAPAAAGVAAVEDPFIRRLRELI